MDNQTAKYYQDNAGTVFKNYMSAQGGVSQYFARAFPEQGSKILDIGAGSGRDLLRLLEAGYDAYGVEPVADFCQLAGQSNLQLSGRMVTAALPDLQLPKDFPQKYDGIVCSAVLQHIPRDELFNSVFAIRRVLKDNGRLLLSLPAARPDLADNERDQNQRLFVMYTPGEIELLLSSLGFRKALVEVTDDSLNRPAVSWINMVFVLYKNHQE